MTYEKSNPAKNFFTRFPREIEKFQKMSRASVRQTRTYVGVVERALFDK